MNKPQLTPSSREVAARLIHQWRTTGEMPERAFPQIRRDRAFIMEMVLGIVRRDNTMHWIVRSLARRAPDEPLSALLAVGLYQLLFMDHVEPYAAVHETVAAARRQGGKPAAGFVNAILRRAQREKNALLASLEKQPLAIRCGHPPELLERWTQTFGAEAMAQLCAWNNERPDLILRVRPTISTEGFETAFESAGVDVRAHTMPGFYIAPTGVRVDELPGYAEGWFTVQDPATLLAVDLLGGKPGERLLDACAAPGGKTLAIAERLERQGELVATDSSVPRLRVLHENLSRCGQGGVSVRRADATRMTLEELGSAPFDGALLDVPCSNTGVIRRHPDVRWRITTEHLAQLVDLQARMLLQGADWIRPGGRLVYSTCSLEPEENENQVRRFLTARPDFTLSGERRSFPPEDGMDGAYAARLEKKPE